MLLATIVGALLIAGGCGGQEKEKEPEVSVQTTPAEQAPIAQSVSAEVVIFPLEQATIAPKITSTVRNQAFSNPSAICC